MSEITGLGHGLHPGADERDQLPGEEQAVVAVAQRAQGVRQVRHGLILAGLRQPTTERANRGTPKNTKNKIATDEYQ